MKRALLLLVVALFIPAAVALQAAPGDVTVGAEFLEEATYLQALAHTALLVHPWSTEEETAPSDRRIYREISRVPIGMHTYSLAIANARGASIYFVGLQAENPLEMRITDPSSGGFWERPTIDVTLRTGVSAECEWDYYSPAHDPAYRAMESSDGRHHEIPDFRENRFYENEGVPLIVRCTAGSTQQTLVFPVGWTTQDTQRIDARITPNPRAVVGAPLTLRANSTLPARCYPSPAQSSYPLTPSLEHVFRELTPRGHGQIHTLSCRDARGNELPGRELVELQDFAGEDLEVVLANPTTATNQENPILAVHTNIPARCTQDFADTEEMGRAERRTQHHRQLSLSHGTPSGTVTCVSETDQTATLDVELQVLLNEPQAAFDTAPEMCEDTLIATIGTAQQQVTHFIVSTPQRAVMREARSTQQAQFYRFSDLGVSVGDTVAVRAVDRAGNIGPETTATVQQSTLSAEECQAIGRQQYLRLSSPPGGATDDDAFDVVIRSDLPAECEYRFSQGEWNSITTSLQTTHAIEDFHAFDQVEREATTPFDVRCTDAREIAEERFEIHWSLPPPEISVSANPTVVDDIFSPYSNITVTANQDVRCGYETDIFTPNYAQQHRFELAIAYGIGQREVVVTCMNRALRTVQETVTIREQYPSEMTINIIAPQTTTQTSVPVEVRTSLPATCFMEREGATRQEMSSTSGTANTEHSQQLTLSEGRHNLTVDCQEIARPDSSAQRTHEILVDRTPPTVTLDGTPYTCGLTRVLIAGNVSDNIGIDYILITFNNAEYNVSSLPHTIRGLSLTANETYTYTVQAFDLAGNPSQEIEAEIVARTEDAGACDTTPPRGVLMQRPLNEGTEYWLICEDDTACEDEYRIGTSSIGGECRATETHRFSQNETFLAEESIRVCWRVSDTNNNIHEGSREVIVIDRPDHCFNNEQDGDETGVDCGGSCAPCQEDQACTEDSDCESGVCGAEGTCEANSCENNIQDGGETDVDCGGFGTGCPRCEVGQSCEEDFDCASNVCLGGVCQEPSCEDGRVNNEATDVDCGGPNCPACAETKRCSENSDCESNVCQGGRCVAQDADINDPAPTDFDRDQPTDWDDQPAQRRTNWFGIVLIILGLISIAGGGGYMYWEKGHGVPSTSASTSSPTQPRVAQPGQQTALKKPEQPKYDFAESKLREEARQKKRSERHADRKDLLKHFDDNKNKKK